jgi:acetyl-CoA carboxylase carboxyltransferase component
MSALAERTTVEQPRTLDAYGRIEALCDHGSLHVIRSTVLPRRESKRMQPGDGVVGAAGMVAGRPVYCYAQDQSFCGGSLGEAHADTIVRVMELAERAGAPVVGFIASGGARMDDGIAALAGYGRIFRHNVRLSGRVPQISTGRPATMPAAPTTPSPGCMRFDSRRGSTVERMMCSEP